MPTWQASLIAVNVKGVVFKTSSGLAAPSAAGVGAPVVELWMIISYDGAARNSQDLWIGVPRR
jgi:hypothetical protein